MEKRTAGVAATGDCWRRCNLGPPAPMQFGTAGAVAIWGCGRRWQTRDATTQCVSRGREPYGAPDALTCCSSSVSTATGRVDSFVLNVARLWLDRLGDLPVGPGVKSLAYREMRCVARR
eukprot:6204568-Pleurochrysis_carterae.AAC.1